jgi:ParB/RepB/Spo0J family partition protein
MSSKKKYSAGDAFRPPVNEDVAFLLAGAPEETAERAEARNLPLTHLPVAAIAPDPYQLRRLPHPSALAVMAESGDQGAKALLDGLRELGASIQQNGQIQPVIVYADTDPEHPEITHRLLNGQRRWSGALLAGLHTIWAVEVPRPSEVVKILHQHEENERRAGFTDMERAWAIVQLKDAIQQEAGGEVPWSVVEEQLHLSTQRRQDLMRLLRFSSEGQAIVLRHGWSEWTLRALHSAINAGAIDAEAATQLLRELATQGEVTAPVVAAAVEAYRAEGTQQTQIADGQGAGDTRTSTASAPQPDILKKTVRLRRGLDQVRASVDTVQDAPTRAAMMRELELVMNSLEELLKKLAISN